MDLGLVDDRCQRWTVGYMGDWGGMGVATGGNQYQSLAKNQDLTGKRLAAAIGWSGRKISRKKRQKEMKRQSSQNQPFENPSRRN